ncbi:MAG: GNAT family N-acetyltransferase, partial [bacterium]
MPASNAETNDETISYRIIRTTEEFDHLRSEWTRIWENSNATIFQTFEWQRTWWKCFGESQKHTQLLLILALNGNSVRGIAPCLIQQISTAGILTFRQLKFIGHGISDYLDLLCEPGYEETVHSAVVDALTSLQSEYDVAVLEDFPDASSFFRPLHDACTRHGFTGTMFEITQCPRTNLQETWEGTLGSLSAKHRKDIAYELRNINRKFEVQFELTTSADVVSDNMDHFIAMHQERWIHAGHQGVFEDSVQARFHKEVATACFQQGWLFLAFLRLNGKRVAVNYGFHCKERVMTYLNGMIA